MDDSQKKKIAMFDMRLGNEPNFLRECDLHNLPKFQMLTEAYQRYPGLVRWKSGVRSTQMCTISCTFWPELQSILFSRS